MKRLCVLALYGTACVGTIGHGHDDDIATTARDQPAGEVAAGREPPASTSPGDATGKPLPSACTSAPAGRRLLRRLTSEEFDNTVRDLLGTSATFGIRFVADEVLHGYSNQADGLRLSPLLAEQIAEAATTLAAHAVARMSELNPYCRTSDAACTHLFVERFGLRAYRRPLTPDEIGRYLALYQAELTGGTHAEGIQSVVAAMLQAPGFLYRRELGRISGARAHLDSYEIAGELSYLFLSSMPDAALFDAAAVDRLRAPDEIERQARRLLQTTRGKETLARFARAWLGVGRLASVAKDSTTYPMFDDALRRSLATELDRFVTAISVGEGTLAALVTADYTFADERLAAVYGLTRPAANANDFVRVPAKGRGIFTRAAVMTTHAAPARSSPVHRGHVIRERVLCGEVPEPPPGVVAALPEIDAALPVRERLARHLTDPACRSCHQLLDPIGLAFEHFDGVGRYRTVDERGRAIDATAAIIGSGRSDASLTGADALASHLAQSPEVHQCFVREFFRFALGDVERDATLCALSSLYDGFRADKLSLVELFVRFARAPHFLERSLLGG